MALRIFPYTQRQDGVTHFGNFNEIVARFMYEREDRKHWSSTYTYEDTLIPHKKFPARKFKNSLSFKIEQGGSEMLTD